MSSAAQDLAAARAAVIEAIYRSGCEPLAMESYGADTRPPVERCLHDVAACDVYVGIVAWRYGSAAPGTRKSFTHLEYDEARRLRKPILLFHLHEDATWPTRHVDPSQRDVRALRFQQARDHVVEYFSSLEQLTSGVRRALHGLYGTAEANVPKLLPYVADRQAQHERLLSAVARAELADSPSVLVVHGAADQAHHKFVEYLQEDLLCTVLGVPGPVATTAVALRPPDVEHQDLVTRRIAMACSLPPTADVDLLADQLHAAAGLTMLRFPMELEVRRGRPRTQAVSALLRYFARWPRQQPLRLIPVLSLQYQDTTTWADRVFGRGSRRPDVVPDLEATAAAAGATAVVLPELTDVERLEVEVWTDRPEVRARIAGADPIPAIRRMFREHERATGSRGMPMETLAIHLTQLLRDPPSGEEAA